MQRAWPAAGRPRPWRVGRAGRRVWFSSVLGHRGSDSAVTREHWGPGVGLLGSTAENPSGFFTSGEPPLHGALHVGLPWGGDWQGDPFLIRQHHPVSGPSTCPLPAAASLASGCGGAGVCLVSGTDRDTDRGELGVGGLTCCPLPDSAPPPGPGEGGRSGHTLRTASLGLSRQHLIYLS